MKGFKTLECHFETTYIIWNRREAQNSHLKEKLSVACKEASKQLLMTSKVTWGSKAAVTSSSTHAQTSSFTKALYMALANPSRACCPPLKDVPLTSSSASAKSTAAMAKALEKAASFTSRGKVTSPFTQTPATTSKRFRPSGTHGCWAQ